MFALLALSYSQHRAASIPLDPKGVTTLRGPSGVGKSTLLDAALFTLTGANRYGDAIDHHRLPEGFERVEAALTTSQGGRFERSMKPTLRDGETVSRAYKGTFVKAGQAPLVATTEAGIAANLPDALRRPELLRLVMAPMQWRKLAEGPGGGRPLRDFLARTLVSAADTRAEVARLMGDAGLRDNDPVDPKGAESQRAAAKTSATAAGARLLEAQTALASLPAAIDAKAPSKADEGTAAGFLTALTAWEDYDDHRRRYDDTVTARANAEAKLATWRDARALLPDRPAVDAEALKATSAALVRARELAAEMRTSHANATLRVVEAGRAVEAAEMATDTQTTEAEGVLARAEITLADLAAAGDVCPTCNRAGWEQAAKALDAAGVAREKARHAVETAKAGAPDRRAKAVAVATETLKKAQAALARVVEGLGKAEAAETDAIDAQAAHRDVGAKAATWDAAKAAIGAEPALPAAPGDAPVEPEEARPSEDDLAWARGIVTAARDAGTVAVERKARREAAEKVVADRDATAKDATTEAARNEALVAAVRVAPTAALEKAIGAFRSHLGPVHVELGEDGSVAVYVDTATMPRQAWYDASDGEQIRADAFFRDALRRVAKVAWLPLCTDRSNLNTLGWPTWGGPVWLLETGGDELVSSAGAVVAAGAAQAAK